MGVINLGALVEKLKKKMASSFVSKTDYPSGSDAGVIKVDSTYATAVTSGGKLKAAEITAEAYSEANDAAFISKATLDNVLAAQPAPTAGVTFTEIYTGSYTSGDQSFTYPSGKSFADYSGMVVVAQNSDDIDTLWLPKEIFSLPTYYVQAKIGEFFNDSTERKILFKLAKDGSGVYGGSSTGNIKITKVYVF